MRWFVSRNGETVGPLDEAEVAERVRRGELRDASVRDEGAGGWMPVPQSPFGPLLPPDPAVARTQTRAMVFLALVFAGGALFYWQTCNSVKEHSRQADAAFCTKWLDYYEKFCAENPTHCAEGPRKLAKCDP